MAIVHSVHPEAGVPKIDSQTCTRCGQCARICPSEVLELRNSTIVVKDSPFGCFACGHCMMVCPNGSITVTGRGVSPSDLVDLPPRSTQASPESLAALMVSRRSVRFFSKKEVPCEILDQIIQMAESAPMGIPPWDVGCVVLRDRKQVQDLAGKILHSYAGFLKIFKPWVLTLMRPMLGRARYEQFKTFIRPLAEMLVDNQKRGRDALFYDAPVAMIFHHSAYADVPDAVIPCTYAMLAAESLGLGTTMIGSVAPMLQRDKALSALIGIPPGNKAAIVLILGYPAVTFKRAIRRRFLGAK